MDSRVVRRARVAVAVTFAVHGAVTGSFATRIPWLQERLHAGPGELGLALLAPAVGSLVAMPMAGRLVHRLGGRAATRWLLALWSVMLAFPALAPNLAVLWVTLLVYGAVAGMCDVAMNAQGVVVEQRMGRSIMSGLHGMWSVGGLVAGAVGVVAAQSEIDARVHLGVMAVVLLAVSCVIGPALLDVRAEAGQVAPPRFVLPSRRVLALGLIGFCAVFGESASQDWCAVYLKQITGTSSGVAAASFTAFALTMAAGRLCGDAVVRRLGAVWTVRVSGMLATLGGVLVVAARTPVPAIAGFMLIGLGVAVVVPLVFTAAANAAPTPSEGVAGAATISYTSGFVAPSAIGAIASVSSLPVSFLLVTVLMSAVLLGAGVLARRPAARDTENATVL
ncbi:MFS transporter [Sphaerisporangium flaviroseum]|uniref:MFS transporter n=1 Tax=Sphaerisporangium flaviroseum TaxID=509199 RepID=A0ABP7IKT1_9ACTN